MILTIRSGNSVVVTVPYWVSYKKGREFALEHKRWILQKINKIRKDKEKSFLERGGKKEYEALKEDARRLVFEIIEKYNKHYKFKFSRVFIRNQRTRWGSCSDSKNLNFNYRIVKLKRYQAEYLVVHELCHLKEMNHSKKFWSLVGKTISDFKRMSKELRAL